MKVGSRTARAGARQVVAWNPLAKPLLERDTMFLLDADFEASLLPEQGQIVPGAQFDAGLDAYVAPASFGDPDNPIDIVDGCFRRGVRSPDADNEALVLSTAGLLALPIEMPTDEFHLQMCLKSDGATLGGLPLRILSSSTMGIDLSLGWSITWNSPGFANYVVPTESRPASGTTAYIACGLDPVDSTLKYWLNGELLSSQVVTPPVEPSSGTLYLFRSFATGNRYTVSDVRLSARYREPQEQIVIQGRPRVIVDPTTPTGKTTNKRLLGAVKGLGNQYTIDTAADKIEVVRIDKLLSATPIKAGGTDGTHPTLGASGDYSYDWQVVDRAVDYVINTLGAQIYLSVDSTPSIFGGAAGPYTGTDLTSALTNDAAFNKAQPTDLVGLATVIQDFLDRIVNTLGATITHAGVWNEPEAEGFLHAADEPARRLYYVETLYPAIANAVKDFDAAIKVGGPELSGWNTTWVTDLVEYCTANLVPLDFISWHWYISNVWLMSVARRQLDEICVAAGADPLEFVIGEWFQAGVTILRVPPMGSPPKYPDGLDIFHGSYGAAWLARALMEFVRTDTALATIYVPEDTVDPGYTPGGALLTSTHKWPTLNVFEQWQMMADDIVDTTIENGPVNFDAMAAVDGDQIDVLLAYQDYRNYNTHPITLEVPVDDGTPVTVYVVDDEHSNWQSDPDREDLESYQANAVSNGEVTLRLGSRTSALVRIG